MDNKCPFRLLPDRTVNSAVDSATRADPLSGNREISGNGSRLNILAAQDSHSLMCVDDHSAGSERD